MRERAIKVRPPPCQPSWPVPQPFISGLSCDCRVPAIESFALGCWLTTAVRPIDRARRGGKQTYLIATNLLSQSLPIPPMTDLRRPPRRKIFPCSNRSDLSTSAPLDSTDRINRRSTIAPAYYAIERASKHMAWQAGKQAGPHPAFPGCTTKTMKYTTTKQQRTIL